jgi:trk system potassium uptake protein TrkH
VRTIGLPNEPSPDMPTPINNANANARWEVRKRSRWLSWRQLSPPQIFVGSFLLLIVLGTLGLKLLPGICPEGKELSWVDAAFTSTSAVCVTGLVVNDTAKDFTFAGQAFILLLIQLGGLGIVSFTSLIFVALGRRLSLRHEALSTSLLEVAPHLQPRKLIRDVVLFTLTLEGIGAVLLYLLWAPGLGWDVAVWHAIFHSVSAFCNAGFSTFGDPSLTEYQRSPSLFVIMALIVAGGLGFLTLEEMFQFWRARRKKAVFRVSLHSRLALTTTAVLILGGWFLFLSIEWNHTLAELPVFDKVTNSLFMSITPRTAGFNTINYREATDATCFITFLLMMIGGSPGSTAGGLKTTTFALLAVVAWSRFRGDQTTSLWNRSLREETVNRTIGLTVVAIAVVLIGLLMLSLTEIDARGKFLPHAFEVASAFNTVGLSMGVTSDLDDAGKLLLIALMLLGRVGTTTFAAALAVRYARAGRFRYAYEDVLVG